MSKEKPGQAHGNVLSQQGSVTVSLSTELYKLIEIQLERRKATRGSIEYQKMKAQIFDTARKVMKSAETYFEIDQVRRLLIHFQALQNFATLISKNRFEEEDFPDTVDSRTLRNYYVTKDGDVLIPLRP
jgi:hypothetical protein